ncbi:hypothetical protein CC2G_013573 [Coprinopsis cinerea AmutBmut pab1-1]|nr:hypothetical protein CC2G_013573 [Coprinopsis cinerea AmutBmut pab1-1]
MGFIRFTLSRRSIIGSDPLAKRVFTYLITAMFILSTYWMGVNIYRFLEAYAFMNVPGGLPIYYFRDFSIWYNFSYAIISSMLFWIADFLAIYRCFIIWDRSYRIVALPFLLLVASIGTNGVNFHFFLNGPKAIPNGFRTIVPLLDFVYPGHLGQNVMTTALIAYKIWRRHSESRAAGIRVTSTITLLGVARIVVESAMIYTMQMLALVVLHIKKHPLRVVFQAAIVPSTGIVFVLITMRIQRAVKESARQAPPTSILFPRWVDPEDPTSTTYTSPRRRTHQSMTSPFTSPVPVFVNPDASEVDLESNRYSSYTAPTTGRHHRESLISILHPSVVRETPRVGRQWSRSTRSSRQPAWM